ncbi:MAG: hypothetical protein JW837_09950 [Sedimentisphaerales bacterium]|nr:hypothetical protein [Sedimentisphaerales bacterium]
MTLIAGDNLSWVVSELKRRNVKLFHACQLCDLKSYLVLDGVPSRNLLNVKNLTYTSFDTDERDKQNSVNNLVFFNLSDFGHWFAKGKNTIPNIYGPILLCFDPNVIRSAINVSITLRSAGACDFDRIAEGISANNVPKLFVDSKRNYIRFKNDLRKEFGCLNAQSPEISCVFKDELAHLMHLTYIIVDPYNLDKGSLENTVCQLVQERNLLCNVQKRYADGYKERYHILFNAINNLGVRSAQELRNVIPNNSPLSDWCDSVMSSQNLSFQFRRYARYLIEGTVNQ